MANRLNVGPTPGLVSDVLRGVKMTARSSADATAALQHVTHAVTKRLVEEPVKHAELSGMRGILGSLIYVNDNNNGN